MRGKKTHDEKEGKKNDKTKTQAIIRNPEYFFSLLFPRD